MLPQVSAFAKYGNFVEQKSLNNPFEDGEWRGGINFNWNFFQFGKDIDGLQGSIKTKEKVEINLNKVKEDIEINLTSAYLDILRVEKSLESTAKAVKASEESYKLDRERYDAGLITTADLLLTEVQYRQAVTNYNKLLNSYYMAFEKYRSIVL
jgi:OMF family outer membrane factor